MPPRAQPQFELIASVPGAAAQRLTLPIRLPAVRTPVSASQRPYVDTTSITPRAGLAFRAGEPIRVSARLAPGARAEFFSAACPGEPPRRSRRHSHCCWTTAARPPRGTCRPAALRCGGTLAVFGPGDTVAAIRSVPAVADGDALGLVRVGTVSADTDAVVIARPIPGGTYKWFILPGTVMQATGRQGDALRVRLDAQLDVWIDASAATPLPTGTPAPRRVVSNARVVPGNEYVDLVLPMSDRPALSRGGRGAHAAVDAARRDGEH